MGSKRDGDEEKVTVRIECEDIAKFNSGDLVYIVPDCERDEPTVLITLRLDRAVFEERKRDWYIAKRPLANAAKTKNRKRAGGRKTRATSAEC